MNYVLAIIWLAYAAAFIGGASLLLKKVVSNPKQAHCEQDDQRSQRGRY